METKYELKEKFNIPDGKGQISDFPLSFRQALYEEITELLDDADKRIKEGGRPGCVSEIMPVTYIFSTEEVIGIITLYNTDGEATGDVMTFRIIRDNMDDLLKERNV